MHRKRDVEIAVNCAVNEFDFENVTAFAVANLCDRARLDRLAAEYVKRCGLVSVTALPTQQRQAQLKCK